MEETLEISCGFDTLGNHCLISNDITNEKPCGRYVLSVIMRRYCSRDDQIKYANRKYVVYEELKFNERTFGNHSLCNIEIWNMILRQSLSSIKPDLDMIY